MSVLINKFKIYFYQRKHSLKSLLSVNKTLTTNQLNISNIRIYWKSMSYYAGIVIKYNIIHIALLSHSHRYSHYLVYKTSFIVSYVQKIMGWSLSCTSKKSSLFLIFRYRHYFVYLYKASTSFHIFKVSSFRVYTKNHRYLAHSGIVSYLIYSYKKSLLNCTHKELSLSLTYNKQKVFELHPPVWYKSQVFCHTLSYYTHSCEITATWLETYASRHKYTRQKQLNMPFPWIKNILMYMEQKGLKLYFPGPCQSAVAFCLPGHFQSPRLEK